MLWDAAQVRSPLRKTFWPVYRILSQIPDTVQRLFKIYAYTITKLIVYRKSGAWYHYGWDDLPRVEPRHACLLVRHSGYVPLHLLFLLYFIVLYWWGGHCCPMHCALFKIHCAPPNLGITRTWIYRLILLRGLFFQAWRSNESEISDSGPPA